MRAEKTQLPQDVYFRILERLQLCLPNIKLHSYISLAPSPNSRPLLPGGFLFDHIILNEHRYRASSRSVSNADSLVAVRIATVHGTRIWVGELLAIFAIKQEVIGTHYFGYMRWLRPTDVDLSDTVWEQL